MQITDFLVSRDDISHSRTATRELPELGDGQALFELQRFGFSANNITYATLGDAMSYWNFFPAEDGWGSVPVWGFARVVDSRCDGVEAGSRYFGYFPLSTHLIVEPRRVTPEGFIDGAAHRVELPAVYQRYQRAASDNSDLAVAEDQQALWRPLFTTSFGAADFIHDHDAFGASAAMLTSASSKTAMGTAFCLKASGNVDEVVGLTSAGNVDFCEGTGYYDRVVSYDDLDAIGQAPQLLIDFAGDNSILTKAAEIAGDALKRTIVIGVTHWQDRERNLTDLGPKTDFFFLPTWIVKRREDWGPAEFFDRSEKSWQKFAPTTESWLRIEEQSGIDGIKVVYESVLAGNSRPATGHILQFT